MFSDSLSYGSLPHTLTQASITLQLKPVKINTECGSHQPISLQNSDVKILAKALASIMPSNHDTRCYFTLGHHSITNVHRLLNVIHSPTFTEIVTALDTEKAFDRV